MILCRPTCICLTLHTQTYIRTDPCLPSVKAHCTLSHTVWLDEISARSHVFCQVRPDYSDSAQRFTALTGRLAQQSLTGSAPVPWVLWVLQTGVETSPSWGAGGGYIKPLRKGWTSRLQVTGWVYSWVSTSLHSHPPCGRAPFSPHPL